MEIDTWELTVALWGSNNAKKLLNEGWEPISVRKGDFVVSGLSLGWILGTHEICFRRKIKRLPY